MNIELNIDTPRFIVSEKADITPHRMDDAFLLRFLRARNYRVEPAFRLVSIYCIQVPILPVPFMHYSIIRYIYVFSFIYFFLDF